jgi:3-hydroxy-9,10-secoandrosta-1,3,5(10)-triene-9,17-dione monooxygenase reductase component
MVDAQTYRQVMGHLPTGVTVVTAYSAEGPTGMAVNSVTSVSLDPPLVLLCPAKSSQTWPEIRRTGRFCINVMAGHHEPACRRFSLKDTDRFAGLALAERVSGPALADAVAWVDCELRQEHDAGDHTIAVAEVLALEAAPDAAPLVFFRGRYGTVAVAAT